MKYVCNKNALKIKLPQQPFPFQTFSKANFNGQRLSFN